MLKQPKFNTAEATKNWKIKKINYLEFGNKLHLLSVIEDNQPINHPILKFCTGKQLKDAIKNEAISFLYCWRIKNKMALELIKKTKYPRLSDAYNEMNQRLNEGKNRHGTQQELLKIEEPTTKEVKAEDINWS